MQARSRFRNVKKEFP